MFGKIKDNLQEIREEVKSLIESNLGYYKLWAFKVMTKSASMLLKLFLISIAFVMVLIFFSIAGALAIGYALDNFVYGFLIIGGIYLILGIIIFNLKDKMEKPILKIFSEDRKSTRLNSSHVKIS